MTKKGKVSVHASVSPLAQHQVKQLTESGMFASESDCVQTAISMLFFCTQIDAFAEAAAKFGLGATV